MAQDKASGRGATRREALQMCAAGAVLLPLSAAGSPAAGPAEDELDHALRLLHGAEPQSKQGLSTHAPMVVEALGALGFGNTAVRWIERYRGPVLELPRPSVRIQRDAWRAALGPVADAPSWETANARWGDWREFFAAELAEARWQDVLDTWAARLAPGLCGGATHGIIRTAHAVRAIARRDNAVRRGELARGLAYWASAYQELPARPRTGARAAGYAQALEQLPLHWEQYHHGPAGNIVNGLRQAAKLDHFADARDLVAAPTDVAGALSALSATFASVYLRHGSRHDSIAFVHAVTGPCALRRIAPHVKPETAAAALPYAWQAAAAIYAAYARKEDAPRRPDPRLAPADLAARAVDNGDAHVVKFIEVLLAENAVRPDPAYLAAAEDILERL